MLFKSFIEVGIIASSVAYAAPIEFSALKIPTAAEAAIEARTLIHRESLANLATIDAKTKLPVSFMEYFADCDSDGTLTLLALNIGTSYRNIANGSPASLSIRVGDHAINDNVNPHYPGGIVNSPAGSPRISLQGTFTEVENTPQNLARLTKCFIKRHPDAKWWLPGNPIHTSHWTQFKVSDVYFLGGFGDRAYIGSIPLDLYKAAQPLGDSVETAGCSGVVLEQEQQPFFILTKLFDKLLSIFGVSDEFRVIAEESSTESHQKMPNPHQPNEHLLTMSSDLTADELLDIHQNEMTHEQVAEAGRERRSVGDYEGIEGGFGTYISPTILSNAEAGRRLRAILEAERNA